MRACAISVTTFEVLCKTQLRMAAVESNETLLDEPRVLHYAENSQRFAGFTDKIIHVLLGAGPDDKSSYRCATLQHANAGAMHTHISYLITYPQDTNDCVCLP